MAANTIELPKITLYTNNGCGWSHRVSIVLKELKLPFEEVFIDMDVPRPDWYLKLNPRGLVPTLQYTPVSKTNTLTLTESAPIVTFLTDLYPSAILPATTGHDRANDDKIAAAHLRYRMFFFVETYFTKINPLMFKMVGVEPGVPQEKIVDDMLRLFETEIEPLLEVVEDRDVGTFFAGRPDLSYVEVMTAPFIIRLVDFCNDVIFPARLAGAILDEKDETARMPRFADWAKACMKHPGIISTWDKEYMVPRIVERLPKARAKYAPEKN